MEYIVGFMQNKALARLLFHQVSSELINELSEYDYGDNRLMCCYCGSALDAAKFDEYITADMVLYSLKSKSTNKCTNIAYISLLVDPEDKPNKFKIVVCNINYHQYIIINIDNAKDDEDLERGISFDIRADVYDDDLNPIPINELDEDSRSIANIIFEAVGRITSIMAGNRITIDQLYCDDDEGE